MTFFSLEKYSPSVSDLASCWVAPNCTIVGNVIISANVSVWFGAVIRGDNEMIQIGKGSNIQEYSILHTDKGWPLVVESGCTIGHNSILHGCKIGTNSLVGMGSILLNGVQVGKNCTIGAGTLLVQEQIIPDGSLVVGRPGKVIRRLSQEEISANKKAAITYSNKIETYQSSLKQVSD